MVCTSLLVKYNASFAAMLDRNVYILCVHIDSSLYTPDYVQRANSWVSKESSGTQPQKCTNESRQEPWLVARLLFGEEIAGNLFGKSCHRELEYTAIGISWNGRTGPHPARYGFFQRRKSKCGLREGRPRPHADRKRLSLGREERAGRLTQGCSDPNVTKPGERYL